MVAKKLIEEILLKHGFPVKTGSDNSPANISQVSQGLVTALGIDWKLHCAYRPQSSEQVERMNRTVNESLTILALVIGAGWVSLLPSALFRVRNAPIKWV